MGTFWQDLKYGVRVLVKSPGLTTVAVLSLALGIGANTTIFTVINAIFLNPLPVKDASSLVNVYTVDEKNKLGGATMFQVSFPNYEDFRDQSDVFSGLASFIPIPLTLTGKGDPQQVPGMLATGNYFDVLGVKPARGRFFLPEEDQHSGGRPVAVVSHSLWARMFGSDPDLVGKAITLNARPYTVIGIAPPNFKGTNSLVNPDLVWIPMSRHSQALPANLDVYFEERRALFTFVFGRLKPGVNVERAEAALKTIAARLEREYPDDNEDRSVALASMAEAAVGINQRSQFVLAGGLLQVVVGLVLLIACVNLANLLLARAAAREREMGVRVAMGANRGRLIRQLLTESIVLALAGGMAGLIIAYWARDLLWAARPPFLDERAVQLSLDMRVLGFTLGISLLTGLLFGLVPAIRASDPDLNDTLKVGGRSGSISWGRHRLRSLLVVSEISLALMALIGAGLFLRSLQHAQEIDPGFESKNLFVLAFNLGAQGTDPDRGQQFYLDAIERAEAVPGVEAATVASNFPFGGGFMRSVFPEGREQDPDRRGILVTTNLIAPSFFETLGIPLIRGRIFDDFDRENALPVVVINEAMAERFWADDDPIGQTFHFFGEETMREVVGVVRNTAVIQLGEDPQPIVYLPMRQNYSPFATLQVRTSGDPRTVLSAVRSRVQELDRNLALTNVNTITDLLDNNLWAPRMGAALLGLFGLLGLVLAAMGIYGVMSYSVNQRRREIGVRVALGAERAHILKLVVGQGLSLTAVGLAIGLFGAFAVTRFLASLLYGISPTDPLTFGGIPVLLGLVALLACYVPARRAMNLDPVVSLRYE